MKKIIIIILVLVLAGISYVGFFVFQKDESKVAEIIDTEAVQIESERGSIAGRIIENKPEFEKNIAQTNAQVEQKNISPTVEKVEIKKVSSGRFIKIDPLHYASGEVVVEDLGDKYKLSFQSDFAAAPGPDLYVYLSAQQDFKNTALGGLDTSKTVNLGALKKQSGTQEYLVSKSDFENHAGAVVIWCKQFSVQFSRADLK